MAHLSESRRLNENEIGPPHLRKNRKIRLRLNLPGRRVTLAAVIALICSVGGTPLTQAAEESPRHFTFQGQLLNADGTAALTATVSFTLGVYSPDGACLLYEETKAGVDLSATQGLFSVTVGSAKGDVTKRTGHDPNLTMAQIFANTGALTRAPGSPQCAAGYVAGLGDARTLRVTVTPNGGSAVTLSPDQLIDSAPQAMVAETLQGIGPQGFVQISGNNGAYTVTKAALDTLTGVGGVADASTLHNHDSSYVKIGAYTELGDQGYRAAHVNVGTGWKF